MENMRGTNGDVYPENMRFFTGTSWALQNSVDSKDCRVIKSPNKSLLFSQAIRIIR